MKILFIKQTIIYLHQKKFNWNISLSLVDKYQEWLRSEEMPRPMAVKKEPRRSVVAELETRLESPPPRRPSGEFFRPRSELVLEQKIRDRMSDYEDTPAPSVSGTLRNDQYIIRACS